MHRILHRRSFDMFTIIARSTIATTPALSIGSVIIILLPLLLLALPLCIELLITKEFEPTGAREQTQAC
jgi:hypothetical protein